MKKNRFAILVDEPGRAKLYLKALMEFINNDFSFLKQEGFRTRTKNTNKAAMGNFIIFGTNKKFDYTTVTRSEFEEDYSKLDVYLLSTEFAAIKKRIKKYVRNSGWYYNVDSDVSRYVILDTDYYCYKAPKVKKSPKKKKRKVALEAVQIFNNYVQVGWDNFKIKTDVHGDKFIVVDKIVYWVNRDSQGYGYLTTK